jgi:regulator of RNase E activity RraA
LNLGGSFNHPVACGGVAVNPGDAVLADDCGIVVMAPDVVPGVVRVALAEQEDEVNWVKRVSAGRKAAKHGRRRGDDRRTPARGWGMLALPRYHSPNV